MIATLAFVACSPSLNWREVRNADASYTVLLPAKPASHTRTVTLGELKVEMEMTAAEAEDINFAVASALVDDEGQRKNALGLMQQAMVKNIGGSVSREKTLMLKDGTAATEIEASGSMAALSTAVASLATNGRIVLLGYYDELTLPYMPLFLKQAQLLTAKEWANGDLQRCRDLIVQGRLDVAPLLTHQLRITDVAQAYDIALNDQACLKLVLAW